jgi:hypothetical protein
MGILDPYLDEYGESVTWKRYTGLGQGGVAEYTDTTIKVLWTEQVRVFNSGDGKELMQVAFVRSSQSLVKNDFVIRGGAAWPVIATSGAPNICQDVAGLKTAYLGEAMI